jgi:7-cyano-7-deazaguanine synthase
MAKSVVLLSGGLDSTVNTALAVGDGGVRLAITCDYGQRAAVREIRSAQAVCRHYSIEHRLLSIPWLGELAATPLTRRDMPLPSAAVEGFEAAEARVWIPNRNGILLNMGAACAEALGADRVVAGFNAEEAVTFPDNSAGFVAASNKAFEFSCRGGVRAFSYTLHLDKKEILLLAKRHDVPIQLSWWCYGGEERPCGRCTSCLRFRAAAEASGCADWLAAKGVVFGG